MFSKFRKRGPIGLVILLVLLVFVFPNIFNQKERNAFQQHEKMERARTLFPGPLVPDSVVTTVSDFYTRGKIAHVVLGKHHRDLWGIKVRLPVFHGLDTLKFVKAGGGQQTTSLEVKTPKGLHFTFRSVNKDNANVLPKALKFSFFWPFLRDQASALNPFAAPVVSKLLERLDIYHPHAQVYVIPYKHKPDTVISTLGGQAIAFEEELGKSWAGHPRFGNAYQILKTEALLAKLRSGEIRLDTAQYIRCRLFDFLISDWDRHEKQWKWGIYQQEEEWIAKPIPIDRDMAFCRFDDGWASRVVRVFNNKFQSFRQAPMNVSGLTKNSLTLDRALLKGVERSHFIEESKKLQKALSDNVISVAFATYPPRVFALVGDEDIRTLKYRRDRIEEAANEFYDLVHRDP